MSWLSSSRWVAKECPERVASGAFRDPRPAGGLPHRPLQHGLVQVVPTPLAGDAIHVEAGRGEHPLPDPLPPGVRVFARQRPRELHPPGSAPQIALVLPFSPSEDVGPGQPSRCRAAW